MEYRQLKKILLDLFDPGKLQEHPEEWGFYNEIKRNIQCVGYASNLTEEVILAAGEKKVDVLLTHHDSWEFLYGLKEKCNPLLEKYVITHAFVHAPLDDAPFGTSASLAKALGVEHCMKVMPYAEIYCGGVIGEMPIMEFDSFKEKLSGILQEEVRCFQNNDRPVHKIAVAAGGGNLTKDMQTAVVRGCDTYITGEYGLYSQLYAKHAGLNLFVGSHTNTEILGVKAMTELVCRGTDMRLERIEETNY